MDSSDVDANDELRDSQEGAKRRVTGDEPATPGRRRTFASIYRKRGNREDAGKNVSLNDLADLDDSAPPRSIFERLGGFPTVVAIVDALYTRVLYDNALAPFFQHHSMAALKAHQVKFLTTVFSNATEVSQGVSLTAPLLPVEGSGHDRESEAKVEIDGENAGHPHLSIEAFLLQKHKRLFLDHGLKQFHFQLLAIHFFHAMCQLKLPPALVQEAGNVIQSFAPIFAKGAALYGPNETGNSQVSGYKADAGENRNCESRS
jgi:Bacterial-like globin